MASNPSTWKRNNGASEEWREQCISASHWCTALFYCLRAMAFIFSKQVSWTVSFANSYGSEQSAMPSSVDSKNPWRMDLNCWRGLMSASSLQGHLNPKPTLFMLKELQCALSGKEKLVCIASLCRNDHTNQSGEALCAVTVGSNWRDLLKRNFHWRAWLWKILFFNARL